MANEVSGAPTSDGSDDELLAIVDPSSPSGARARKLTLGALKATLDLRYATAAALALKADASDLEGMADAITLKSTQDALDAAVARIGALEAAVDALQTSSAVTLAALTLSGANFSVDDTEGKVIGTISGKSVGSTLSLDPADGKVTISTDQTKLLVGGTAATAGTLSYDLIETLTGATGSPKTNSITITVSPSAAGGLASTAIPNVTFLVPGTSLITNPRTTKSLAHDYLVGCMSLTNPSANYDATAAAANLTNVLTSPPAGIYKDSSNRLWGESSFTTFSNLYFPPGSEFISSASSIVLDNCFFNEARINPQTYPLTVNNTTLYSPRTGATAWDDIIKEGGQLTLYRTVIIYAPGDALKAKHLKSMRQCVIVGAGDHGDMMQYAPAFASLVEECYFNQCTTATGETSVWRGEDPYAGAIEFRKNVLVVDNINAIAMSSQGGGGTFYMHDCFIMKETDDAGVQYTGGILYPGTTAANGCTINTNPLLSRDASTSSGYRWDGTSYLSETA